MCVGKLGGNKSFPWYILYRYVYSLFYSDKGGKLLFHHTVIYISINFLYEKNVHEKCEQVLSVISL